MSLALVTQHTERVRCISLSSVAPLTVPYFPTLSDKGQDFRKNVTDYETHVLSFSAAFVWNIYYFKKNRARYFHKRNVKCPLFLSNCNEN